MSLFTFRGPISAAEGRLMLVMFNPANDDEWYAGYR